MRSDGEQGNHEEARDEFQSAKDAAQGQRVIQSYALQAENSLCVKNQIHNKLCSPNTNNTEHFI